MQELDRETGIGLIEKKRQGLGKANMIYVKNFVLNNKVKSQSDKKFIKQTNFQDFYYACTGKNKPESYLGIAWIGQRNQCAYFIRTLFGKEKNLWHIGYNVFNIKLLSQSYYNLFNISKNAFSKKTEPINNILKKANISFKD